MDTVESGRMVEVDSGILYKCAIYFGVATMYFYRKDITPIEVDESYGSFYDKNEEVCKRVFDETLLYMKYQLSHEQMGMIIKAYTNNYPMSVSDTDIGGIAIK